MLKRIIGFCLSLSVLTLSLLAFAGCGTDDHDFDTMSDGAVAISFKSATSYEALKALDGQTVTINGFMATSSPANGSFIFLMNMPYQSCPFCKPNTTELSNTIEVYPKKNQKFNYTEQAIKVVGTMKVAKQGKTFSDDYGYEFVFKIENAEYVILKDNELPEEMSLWQTISASGIVGELNSMQDYIYFLSHWPEYFVDNGYDSKGNFYQGYYLYPADAMNYLTKSGAQWSYGYKDGYFDNIITKLESFGSDKLDPMIENVRKAKSFAEKCLDALNGGKYTYEEKYVEKFKKTDYVYTLNDAAALDEECGALYLEFSDWLTSWEF